MGLRRYTRGVTFVELMATLLIVSVVSAWAIPSFVDMTRSNRAKAQAGLLQRSLNYARNEAVRRNARVYVTSLSDSADWGVAGWHVWVDGTGDATYTDGSADVELLVQAPLNGVTLIAKDTVKEIVFLGSGFLNKKLTDPALTFEYRVAGRCNLDLNIVLQPAGRSSMEFQNCPEATDGETGE